MFVTLLPQTEMLCAQLEPMTSGLQQRNVIIALRHTPSKVKNYILKKLKEQWKSYIACKSGIEK